MTRLTCFWSSFVFLLVSINIFTCTALVTPEKCLNKKYMVVHGHKMAYVEMNEGDPIVFLHGNPTSSFLWRNVIPHLQTQGRLIVPDLIGMGDSDKLPPGNTQRYTLIEHANYLFTLLEKLGVKQNVTFVIHDWGSVLGFLWAYRNRNNPSAIKGIAFMEALVRPFSYDTRPEFKPFFGPLKSKLGEKLVLVDNLIIEGLQYAIIRNLSLSELNEYRRPFLTPGEDRRPMLTFARQFPIDGQPADTVNIVSKYSKWMGSTKFPKLLISAVPGRILTGEELKLARSWPNTKEISVPGIHFIQEDSPNEIGKGISDWLRDI